LEKQRKVRGWGRKEGGVSWGEKSESALQDERRARKAA
jgi:hypothetical protein